MMSQVRFVAISMQWNLFCMTTLQDAESSSDRYVSLPALLAHGKATAKS